MILHESGYRVRHGKWVPHDLSAAQKKSRYEYALELERRHRNHPFLDRLITCDETWIPLDNRRPSKQCLRLTQKSKVTPKVGLHPNEVMLCVWWRKYGIIHWELAENRQTIDAELYYSQLEHISEKICEAELRGLYRKGPILQQDNARPHVAQCTLDKIESLGWELLPHPSYSPDAAPSDYYLFSSLKCYLTGKRFFNVAEVKSMLSQYFDSKSPAFYRHGIDKLPEKRRSIIVSNGDYFD
ncbi:transposase [Oesophagostomum dentatum]|uniref:Transposase n=1 Tax=Oesophagostomum dentatum TaxID=61180 RepID=A0A0B1S4I9_OESDE|nr:transposase [Oesophagostomum dentatum]